MCDKISLSIPYNFAYKNLSKGETECIFSPISGHTTAMLEVDDCYVIADTIRFFSENNGAFLSVLFDNIPSNLMPTSEIEYLGDVGGWHSEY